MTDATSAQLGRIEQTLTDHKLYAGHYDRLWKMLEMARLHERDPHDGAPIPAAQAGEIIAWLGRRGYYPKQAPARKQYPAIPEGWYATEPPSGGKLDFWQVEVPAGGKWAGKSFPRRVLGGRSEAGRFRTGKVYGDEARAALEAIAAVGVEAARERFARELEACWKCGIPLTDDLSRELLIGPDCCKKVYGMTQAQRRAELAQAA